MGIYIRGMKLPNSCDTCPMNWRDMVGQLCCRAESYIVLRKENQERPDWCPLVPVPPHGRLIDADALAEHKFVCVPHVIVNDKEAGVAYRLGWNTAIEAIMENAETVIGGE